MIMTIQALLEDDTRTRWRRCRYWLRNREYLRAWEKLNTRNRMLLEDNERDIAVLQQILGDPGVE